MLIPTGTGRPANPLYWWNPKSLIWYTWYTFRLCWVWASLIALELLTTWMDYFECSKKWGNLDWLIFKILLQHHHDIKKHTWGNLDCLIFSRAVCSLSRKIFPVEISCGWHADNLRTMCRWHADDTRVRLRARFGWWMTYVIRNVIRTLARVAQFYAVLHLVSSACHPQSKELG